MKRGFIFILLAVWVGALPAQELNAVLRRHVVNGRIDYAALKADPAPLKRYLESAGAVSESEFRSWGEKRQLAFLINLYNAATLQLIVDHYPVKSIKDIGNWFKGPWDQPVVPRFGKILTLNQLEHEIIRPQYPDPRIHMALVCAAKGCPVLRAEAYTAERLDEQLDDQSRAYLATPAGLVVDREKGTSSISSIFKWYSDDFASVPAFVETYSGQTIQGLKIRYLDYDWSLNEKRE
ncbi:DUF547 domain-containing protein [Pontiella agarivorans]|uniref:DUF547 domain-containing protein n=1 Tax=Pontiella agarivorans TaxID=3038953 RepID=A0ABU5MVG2_9BACT|nr:DUF547 domain-containing protein [Pontiella agarivorans]MDZ8118219.1 DUF547 domain-containing protein [Pontiella agarivorans]